MAWEAPIGLNLFSVSLLGRAHTNSCTNRNIRLRWKRNLVISPLMGTYVISVHHYICGICCMNDIIMYECMLCKIIYELCTLHYVTVFIGVILWGYARPVSLYEYMVVCTSSVLKNYAHFLGNPGADP